MISASLPPQIAAVTEVVRLIRANPLLDETKVLVGGRAFGSHSTLWRVTGADDFAVDVNTAVSLLD